MDITIHLQEINEPKQKVQWNTPMHFQMNLLLTQSVYAVESKMSITDETISPLFALLEHL